MGFKKVLGKIIPVAASVASSGLLGGGVATAIQQTLKLKPNASDADIEKALASASPEQYVELHRIEAETKRHAKDAGLKLAELAVEEERIHAGDRDSARKREIAVQDKTPAILTWGVLGLLGTLSILLLFVDPPDSAEMLLGGIIGALTLQFGKIGAYYFGSSKGSKDKDAAIQTALAGRQSKP